MKWIVKTAIAVSWYESKRVCASGSRASSARFETVSIPVYAIIPIRIAANWLQVGAVPQTTFSFRVSGLNTSTKPRITSSTWVEKSMTERVILSPADSLDPDDVDRDEEDDHAAPTTMSQGFVRSGSQKIDR